MHGACRMRAMARWTAGVHLVSAAQHTAENWQANDCFETHPTASLVLHWRSGARAHVAIGVRGRSLGRTRRGLGHSGGRRDMFGSGGHLGLATRSRLEPPPTPIAFYHTEWSELCFQPPPSPRVGGGRGPAGGGGRPLPPPARRWVAGWARRFFAQGAKCRCLSSFSLLCHSRMSHPFAGFASRFLCKLARRSSILRGFQPAHVHQMN